MTQEESQAVLAAHEGMCWWVARRTARGLSEEDIEDVAAEVRMQFWRATQHFDPALGYTFSTYAMRVAVAQARRTAWRIRARGVHVPRRAERLPPNVTDLDAPIEGHDGERLGDLIAARESTGGPEFPSDFWERVRCRLTARQYECLSLQIRDGLSAAAVGRRLGVTSSNVRILTKHALQSLRECGFFSRYESLLP